MTRNSLGGGLVTKQMHFQYCEIWGSAQHSETAIFVCSVSTASFNKPSMTMFEVSMKGFPRKSRMLLRRFANIVSNTRTAFLVHFIHFLLVTAVEIHVVFREFCHVASPFRCGNQLGAGKVPVGGAILCSFARCRTQSHVTSSFDD